MTSNSISWGNKSRTGIPVLVPPQYSEYPGQDNGENKSSQSVVPSFVVVFNDDEVTISSKNQGKKNALQEQFAAPVLVPQSSKEIAERQNSIPFVANSTGVSLSSESVRNGASFGPYDIEINQYAMKRYNEASSFRVWCSSTFEVTV